jgi:hypothetical protein
MGDLFDRRAPFDTISPCGLYRYFLAWPTGIDNDRACLGCFANPSTATRDELDPTLRRWLGYCRSWGFGWSWTVNARAWRATDPNDVPKDPFGIGPDNDAHILRHAAASDVVVVGWGKLGGARGHAVLDLIRRAGRVPHALKLNQDGSPSHPLYLRASLKPFRMEVAGG